MRTIQEVKIEPKDMGSDRAERHTHPAFAQISAHRISGGAVLYGSDFKHQNFIRIGINASELTRNLSNDWPFARESYIEVDVSEAQWAHFVSSLNCGSGTQCTLRSKCGEQIPEIPLPVQRHAQFADEIRKTNAEAVEAMAELRAAIEAAGLSGKKAQALAGLVSRAERAIGGSSTFVAAQFGEHMERVTQAAKAEVNAYALHILGGREVPLQLPAPPEKTPG